VPRRRYWDLVQIIASLAVACGCLALFVRSSPFLLGVLVGVFLALAGVIPFILMPIADGTVHARLGRMVEDDIGTELRKVPGVYTVLSDVSFERMNVDHVVFTPNGCLAVEVKALFGQRWELTNVPDLAGKSAQARDGARKVELLLRSRGVDVPVQPVLLLAGSGAPVMSTALQSGDVTVVRFARHRGWFSDVPQLGHALQREAAELAAAELAKYCEERTEHELSKRRRARSAS